MAQEHKGANVNATVVDSIPTRGNEIYNIVRNRKWLRFKKKQDRNTYHLYVSKCFGKRFYVIKISDMYHSITILSNKGRYRQATEPD